MGSSDGYPELDNKSGVRFNFSRHDGALALVECAYKINQQTNSSGLPGTYKLGAFYHTAEFKDNRGSGHNS